MIFAAVAISVFCFAYGNVEEKNVFVSNDEETSDTGIYYEITVSDSEIIIYEINGDIKEVIKKDRYMPARDSDMILLLDGIECETMEEALKIFEDFVS